MTTKTFIEEIRFRLTQYPHVIAQEGGNTISVSPEGGFKVWAVDQGDEYTVGFDGWHEHFDDMNDAIHCFAWGLSTKCRLKVVSKGGEPCRWTAQVLINGEWLDESTVGSVLTKFWKSSEESYLHNTIIQF